jgi:hypothetical protein
MTKEMQAGDIEEVSMCFIKGEFTYTMYIEPTSASEDI